MTIMRIAGNARMSAAIVHNGMVYLKGVPPLDPEVDITAQTTDVLRQIDDLLAQCGSGRQNAIKVMIWLADMADFTAMNAVYDAWVVAGKEPVRACVEARLASPKLKVEVQVTTFQ